MNPQDLLIVIASQGIEIVNYKAQIAQLTAQVSDLTAKFAGVSKPGPGPISTAP